MLNERSGWLFTKAVINVDSVIAEMYMKSQPSWSHAKALPISVQMASKTKGALLKKNGSFAGI